MNNQTINTLIDILNNLKPTTLAAIAADIDEGEKPFEDMNNFYHLVMNAGIANVGENDFELMIAEAYEYVG